MNDCCLEELNSNAFVDESVVHRRRLVRNVVLMQMHDAKHETRAASAKQKIHIYLDI